MGIARSTYYDKPAISIDDTALVETMVTISDHFESYGYRRMRAALPASRVCREQEDLTPDAGP